MATITQYSNNNIVITEDSGVELMLPSGVTPQKRGNSIFFLNANFATVKSYAAADISEVTDRNGVTTTITDIDSLYNALRDSFFFRVGGTNGLGAIPFAIRSTDSLPAVFTSIALRDAYYTTNPGDIAITTELGRGREAVGIGPTDGSTVGVTAAFIRNAANDDWIPIATNFIGPEGPASTVPGPVGPPGDAFADEDQTVDLTISTGNISTFRNKNVINTKATLGNLNITLGSIASFLTADPTDEFVIRFISESGPSSLVITPDSTNTIAGLASITLSQGQSVTIKLPSSGTTWNLIGSTINGGGGGTLPLRPQAVQGDVVLVGDWDPTGGTFPAGASQGNFYSIVANGTVDGVDFIEHDFLLALIDTPSISTFAGNWRVIPGDGVVHSIAGMQGIITDQEIITTWDRLGYVRNSGIVNPSFHEFRITTIPNRVDLNTDLNGAQTVSFSVTNHGDVASADIQADFTTPDDFADVGTLVNPTIDGTQEQSVVFAGITTDTQKVISFRIRSVDSQGNVHISNEYDVSVRNLSTNEFAYFGVRPTNDFATVGLGSLTAIDVTSSGTTFSINLAGANNSFLGILTPDNRDPASILDPLGQESVNDFTLTPNARTENGIVYNLRTVQNTSGIDGSFTFSVTTE